jgi:hypothetical protein
MSADAVDYKALLLGLATSPMWSSNANDPTSSDDWWPGLCRDLHELGVTTLYGSALYDPDDEDDDE